MHGNSAISVALLRADDDLCRRLRAAAQELALDVVVLSQDETRPDVVVGDHDLPPSTGKLARQLAHGHVALLRLGRGSSWGGSNGATTVDATPEESAASGRAKRPVVFSLPADATPREIVVACQLLGENVRLRRRVGRARRQWQRWARLAHRDPLTGLPNRRVWKRALQDACRHGAGSVCVALFDLDHFKRVNDAGGLSAGDNVLVATAEALRSAIRDADLLVRLGGDEFALLLRDVDASSAAAIIDRVRCQAQARLGFGNEPITISAGWVMFAAQAGADPEKIFAAAAQALAEAKSRGRNLTVSANAASHSAPQQSA